MLGFTLAFSTELRCSKLCQELVKLILKICRLACIQRNVYLAERHFLQSILWKTLNCYQRTWVCSPSCLLLYGIVFVYVSAILSRILQLSDARGDKRSVTAMWIVNT